MNVNFKIRATVLWVVAFVMQLNAQSIPANLNRYINEAAQNNEINANVLIAENGEVLYKNSYGYKNIATKAFLNDSTQFQLASISKTVTAVAVLQLMEKNKFRLDDALVKYLPEFPYPTITIKQLLSHTSGLPDIEAIIDPLVAKQPGKIFTNADDMPALKIYSQTKQLPFQPGERWGYSTLGYHFLALLIEKLSREPFDQYLRNHIFVPAGMNNTYLQTSLSQTKDKNRTLNYLYNNHYEMKLEWVDTLADRREWTYNLTGMVGGNGLVSTAIDLLKFDQALYSAKLLKAATLELAFTPVKLNNGQNNQAIAGTSCGLGWFIFNDTSNGKIVWHSGSNPGVTTLFARNITKKQTYILLQNIAISNPVYKDILSIITGTPATYKIPLGFVYAQDIYKKGPDYAYTHLIELKSDSLKYALKEEDMARTGLEFSRSRRLYNLALETYKLNTLLFANSWKAYADYADVLGSQTANKEAAILAYKKSMLLNPGNEKNKISLQQLIEK
jgi:CubicO group peptidase (beta-lactamase class C family)